MKSIEEIAKEYSQREEIQKAFIDGYNYRMKRTRKGFEFDESLLDPFLKEPMIRWLDYKREINDFYKSKSSILACQNRLVKLSNLDLQEANNIVDFSIAQGYKGLFKENTNSNGRQQATPNHAREQRNASIFDLANQVLQ